MHFRFLKLATVCGLLTILGTTPAVGQFKTVTATQPELELPSQSELRQQALQITVKVSANDDRGSGTLLTKQGSLYTVLTNEHVLLSGAPFKVQTPDSQSHSATLVESIGLQGKDLALLQFQSKHGYKVASLAKVPKLAVEEAVVAAGFPYSSNRPLVTTGKISLLPNQPLKAGYQIGYSNDIQQGMSGGPILNERGELVGINALSAYPILNTAYVFEDGSHPSEKQIAEMRRSSWGLPIQALDKIAPQSLTKVLNSCVESNAISSESVKSIQVHHSVNTCTSSAKIGQLPILAQNTSADFYNRAQERAKAGDFSGAVTELTKAIELEPKNTDALLARAGVYRTLGQIDNSIADYTRVIKLNPSSPYVYHYERGILYSDSRKYNEAINDFTQIIQWKVKDRKEEGELYKTLKENAFWRRGLVYKQLKKYDLAVKDLTQILDAERLSLRNIGIAYLARGDIYLIQGNRQKAVEDWSKAAKLPPPENVSEGRKKVEQIAQAITVKIELKNNDNQIKGSGSGILAARNGKEYYVVTNQHVVNHDSGNYWIVTPDKKRYLVNRNLIKIQSGFDLAVIPFSSDQPYTVATFADYGIISGKRQVVTAGWSTKGSKWHSTNGFMIPADFLIGSALDSSFLSDGYEISYTNVTYGGMSGGPVLDALGQVVGIHGHKVGSNLTDIAWGLGMAIPTNAFLRLSKDFGIDPKLLKRGQNTPSSTDENEILSFDSLSYSPDEYNIRVMLLFEDTAHKPETWFNLANQLAFAGRDSDNLVNPAFDVGFQLRKRLESSDPDQIYDSLLAKVVPLMPDKAALQFLDTAVAANRERFQAWGLKASVFRSLKEPNQALIAVGEALKIEPNNPGLLLQEGYLYMDSKQPQKAVAAYTQAIDRYEEQYKQRNVVPYYVAHFYRMRAAAHRQVGDRASAISDLNRAVSINPGGGSCEELFELYSEAGDQRATQAAICNLETTGRRWEGNAPISGNLVALLTRGAAKLLQGNYDEAVELFTQAISEHQRLSFKTLPDNLYSWRGQALFGLKKYKEALADFEQAIKLNPNKGSHYVQRGLVRGQLGDSQGTMADFDRAIKTELDNAEAYFYRSLVYAARRDMPKAFSDMQKAAELFKARKDGVNYQAALQIMQQWRQNNQPK